MTTLHWARRAIRAGLALVVIGGLAFVPPARGGPTCGTDALSVDGDWTAIAQPDFAPRNGAKQRDSYAVDAKDYEHLLISDGSSVRLSEDGGCSWVDTISSKDAGALTPGAQFRQIYALAIGDAKRAYAVNISVTYRSQVHVFVTNDRGATWSDSTSLTALGESAAIATAPTAGAAAYLAVSKSRLYATTDGGQSWVAGADLSSTPVTGVVVDEQTPATLWVWGPAGLYESTDAGLTAPRILTGEVVAFDAAHPADQPTQLTAFTADGNAQRSTDGGAHWTSTPATTAAPANAAVHAFDAPTRLLASTRQSVLQASSKSGTWIDISPKRGSRFEDARATHTVPTYAYVRTELGLERLVLEPRTGDERKSVGPIDLRPPGRPRITPATRQIKLPVGGQATVDEVLTVPRLVSGVDLVFLADTTSSMSPLIDGLRGGMARLVEALRAADIDLRVGIAELKDYPVGPYGVDGDVPYALRRDLAPYDKTVDAAIGALHDGGGGDRPEAQLAGLFQLASGAGQAKPGAPTFIAPGQSPSFRNGVIRVVVLGTDSPFHRPEDDLRYPGPSFKQAVDALRAKGIKVVGLSVDKPAIADLRTTARGTNALALGDVDCDGDGFADLVPGDALVCPLNSDGKNLAAAVVNQLGAIDGAGVIAVAVADTGGVVRGITPTTFGPRPLGQDNELPFQVSYGCGLDQAGGRFPVALTATVDGRAIARADALVACGEVAVAAAPPPAPPRATLAPVPQPTPAHAISPAASPAPQVAPAPQVMPQIGVQPTFEEQQRAALARIRSGALDGATTRDNELGFSAPLLYATALFMTAGVAVTMRRETKPAVVRHTIRTSPTPRSKLRRRR